jgi:RNA polymerase sigma factor (sigma-70 family)
MDEPRKPPPAPDPDEGSAIPDPASTAGLLQRARNGDAEAVNDLFSRYLPLLRRWARGRLPQWTRDLRDTEDIVQETLVQTFRRLDEFELRHEGALQAYLRQAVMNRVRDEVRRVTRHPVAGALEEDHVGADVSPLDQAIGRQAVERYEAALGRLRPDEREMIVARVEMGNSYMQIAAAHAKPSADAARMAVTRALVRLAEEMDLDA